MELHSIFPIKIQGVLPMLLFSHAHSSKWSLKIRLCTTANTVLCITMFTVVLFWTLPRSLEKVVLFWTLHRSLEKVHYSSVLVYFFILDPIHFWNFCKVHSDKCSWWFNTLLLLSIIHANLKERWALKAQQCNSLGILVQTKDATTSVLCPEEEMVIVAQPKGMTQLASIINHLPQEKDIDK